MGIRLVGVPWVPVPLPEQPWRPASSRRPDSRGRTPEDYQLRDESPSPDARDRGARSDSGNVSRALSHTTCVLSNDLLASSSRIPNTSIRQNPRLARR